MFEKLNINTLIETYGKFKQSKDYQERKDQMKFVEIAQVIINELLKNHSLSNDDLTALIQMLGHGCKQENFLKYLKSIKLSRDKEDYIYNKYLATNKMGYTGRGKNAIYGLTHEHLSEVKNLLSSVLQASHSAEVKQVVARYDELEIPQVTSGIYSPWLYYLKPNICPIITGPVTDFLNVLEWDGYYATAIDFFEQINSVIEEKDLGFIDAFLWGDRWKQIVGQTWNKEEAYAPLANSTISLLSSKRQVIFYGPPGTGKTFRTKQAAVDLIS